MNPYGEEYYKRFAAGGYQRNEFWLTEWKRIAQAIYETVHPGSVFDAGCAMGMLVEAFRDMGVPAWGMDISEYAISKVREDIKPYCVVGSIAEPLILRPDLVVSIEVLEHLSALEGQRAIRNLCAFTDLVLFSSSPYDFTEPTHVNVHNPDYWTELFAREGFFRDLTFDGSFLTDWATLYERKPFSLVEYDRELFRLRMENLALQRRG